MTAPNGFRIPRKKKVNAQEAAALATVAARQQAVGVTLPIRAGVTWALRLSVASLLVSLVALGVVVWR